jgi:threonine/homoserine/homoserine lactone efflux protein
MDLLGLTGFTLTMLLLAAVPSTSVALVVTRSATRGVANGAAVAGGIVLGDLLFVALALGGMSLLAEAMGAFFAIFRYLGGAYLLWIGIQLLRSRSLPIAETPVESPASLLASIASGFFLTLGDIKAILFYASLLPAFIDMHALGMTTVCSIIVITIVTVGGVKLIYAVMARALVAKWGSVRQQRWLRTATGGLMLGCGSYLIAKG